MIGERSVDGGLDYGYEVNHYKLWLSLKIVFFAYFLYRCFKMIQNQQHQEFMDKAEDFADNLLRSSKKILPMLSRLCLVGTFVEDGFRMWYQWAEQRDYIDTSWNCGWTIATAFVIINMIGQLVGSAAILCQKHVKPMCYTLFVVIFLQSLAYSILWDAKFMARSLALSGAVMLLLAESKQEARSMFVGVPTMDNVQNSPKNLMQLSGRIMLVLMFMTLLKYTMKPMDVLRNIIGSALMLGIAAGWKTKINSLLLTFWLMIINISMHDFWRHRSGSIMHDYKKFDFFQTLSVVGGLLMLVTIGPGGVSMDERKKMY